METVNLLQNRMSQSPAFHAVIELKQTDAGGWFYGYAIRLKDTFRLCPVPDSRSTTTQRGEAVKELALVFALYAVSKATPYPSGDDFDEHAIHDALVEEAERELEAVASVVLTKYYNIVLSSERLRFQFSRILPSKFQSYLNIEELISFTFDDSPKPAAAKGKQQPEQEQLSLFSMLGG